MEPSGGGPCAREPAWSSPPVPGGRSRPRQAHASRGSYAPGDSGAVLSARSCQGLARRDGRKRADDGRVSTPGQVTRGLPRLEARIRVDRWVVRDRDPPGTGQEASRWPGVVATGDRHGQDRRGERRREAERARLEGLDATVRAPLALGKDHHHLPRLQQPDRLARGPPVGRLDLDGESVEQPDETPEQGDLEETAPRHVVDTPTDADRDERRVGVGLVVRRDDQGSRRRDVLNADQLETEVGAAERVEPGTEEVQDGCVHALAYTHKRKRGREASRPRGSFDSARYSSSNAGSVSSGSYWRPRRSSLSWQRTQVCTSGMARSRAGEISSLHSTHVPYSPSLSRSSAADSRLTRATRSSRVAKPISRLSLAWISSTSSAKGELSPIAPGNSSTATAPPICRSRDTATFRSCSSRFWMFVSMVDLPVFLAPVAATTVPRI